MDRFKILIVLLAVFINITPVTAMQAAKIEYQVPIDYRYLDEQKISADAEIAFKEYIESKEPESLQKMLALYTLLTNINKDNPLYFVRTGIAYDKLKKDRWAKSYFCQSMCILNQYPYTYAAFGDFWFERCQYRKALRNYLTANEYGYNNNYENLCKIATCYEKLGDYKAAIDYFKIALQYNNNEDLINKIQSLEEFLQQNSLYYEREKRTY